MDFPRTPRAGDPLDPLWGRRVAEALRALRVTGGPGIRVTTTANGTTVAAEPSRPAAAGFPWGSRWPWGLGIEVTAEDDITLTVYNPCARVGRRFFPSIAGVVMLTTPDIPTPMVFEGAPLDDWWGVAVDVDWLGMAPEDPLPEIDLKVFGEAADVDGMFATPDAPHDEWDRIPIAVFEGPILRRYYGPGVYAPALWVP